MVTIVGRREIARRQARLRSSIGAQILELREDSGATQSALAAAAGIDGGHLSRIERGVAAGSLDVLVEIAAQLGADVSVRLFATARPRLVDRFQAPMIDALVRRLSERWLPRPEVPVPTARGVIDLVLNDRRANRSIVCECHSELRRLEHVLRRLNEKTVALAALYPQDDVSSLLLLRSTAATRAVATGYGATLGAAFPMRAADAAAALFGQASWPGPAIVWVRLEAGRAEILDRPPRGVRVGR